MVFVVVDATVTVVRVVPRVYVVTVVVVVVQVGTV